jgi:hypothetical protein
MKSRKSGRLASKFPHSLYILCFPLRGCSGCRLLHARFLFVLHFNPEHGGNKLLRNIGRVWSYCAPLYRRRGNSSQEKSQFLLSWDCRPLDRTVGGMRDANGWESCALRAVDLQSSSDAEVWLQCRIHRILNHITQIYCDHGKQKAVA